MTCNASLIFLRSVRQKPKKVFAKLEKYLLGFLFFELLFTVVIISIESDNLIILTQLLISG